MIKPTIGRIVWFQPGHGCPARQDGSQPLAALVVCVMADDLVNLAVFDADGHHYAIRDVELWQDEPNPRPFGRNFCEWMPYQKGQAAKQDAKQ